MEGGVLSKHRHKMIRGLFRVDKNVRVCLLVALITPFFCNAVLLYGQDAGVIRYIAIPLASWLGFGIGAILCAWRENGSLKRCWGLMPPVFGRGGPSWLAA